MNRDAAIEAGARTLWVTMRHYPEIDWQEANAQGHPGVKFCRRQSVTVIDAALPHLVGEPVGYALLDCDGESSCNIEDLDDARDYVRWLNEPKSGDFNRPYRVVALIPVVEP